MAAHPQAPEHPPAGAGADNPDAPRRGADPLRELGHGRSQQGALLRVGGMTVKGLFVTKDLQWWVSERAELWASPHFVTWPDGRRAFSPAHGWTGRVYSSWETGGGHPDRRARPAVRENFPASPRGKVAVCLRAVSGAAFRSPPSPSEQNAQKIASDAAPPDSLVLRGARGKSVLASQRIIVLGFV